MFQLNSIPGSSIPDCIISSSDCLYVNNGWVWQLLHHNYSHFTGCPFEISEKYLRLINWFNPSCALQWRRTWTRWSPPWSSSSPPRGCGRSWELDTELWHRCAWQGSRKCKWCSTHSWPQPCQHQGKKIFKKLLLSNFHVSGTYQRVVPPQHHLNNNHNNSSNNINTETPNQITWSWLGSVSYWSCHV